MRNNPRLNSADGFVRTDTDHTILRYKTYGSRDFQLMMDLETKERGAEPDPSQKDILSFKHELAIRSGKNMHGAATIQTAKLKSRLLGGRRVNVRYLGYHLLQFENTNPKDSVWIKWNGKEISETVLTDLLRFDRDPWCPTRSMMELLRDRHVQPLVLPHVLGAN